MTLTIRPFNCAVALAAGIALTNGTPLQIVGTQAGGIE